MDILTLILIAIGLNFDSFAVSVTTGFMVQKIRFWQATRIALVLAVFQGGMPLIGWFLGSQVKDYIAEFDHWIAFGLLAFIGIRMIIESLAKEEDREFKPLTNAVILGMALATSIDALIAGVSFAFIDLNILLTALLIGFLTYVAAMLGMLFGKKAGKWFGKKMEIVGGIILIGLGVKILLGHLL
ncbi:MAG: manganese efflux pump MntP family protein [Bacteroidota bacterium]